MTDAPHLPHQVPVAAHRLGAHGGPRRTPPLGWLVGLFLFLASTTPGLAGAALQATPAPPGVSFPTGAEATPLQAPQTADSVPRGMIPDDYHRLTFVGDPQISPDGEWVAFTARTVSEDRRRRVGGIWLAPFDASAPPRRITRGDADSRPRWSPDGSTIAFLGSRNERTQLHLLRMAGGEAEPVTELRQGSIASFGWLPDGERLLLELTLDPAVEDPREPAPDPDPQTPAPDVVEVRHAVYKADGTGYLDDGRRHLWLLTLQDGTVTRITAGDSLWNDRNAALSRDGRWIAFDRDTTGEEYDGSFNQDLMVLSLDGVLAGVGEGSVPRRVPQPEGRVEAPLWSPDGSRIAVRHTPEPYARGHLALLPAEGTEPREGVGSPEGVQPQILTEEVDLAPANLVWHPSGTHLLFTADREGATPLLRLEADGSGARVLLGEEGTVSAVTLSDDGERLAFAFEDETSPAEIWVARADGSEARPLTSFNREALGGLVLNRLEEFRFTNPAGFELQGFLLRPVGWTEGQRYPLVLNIKGGPGGMWGRQWFHEFQMMAAAGYAVAFTNYRGSSGYGHDFQAAVRLDYGGADAEDNLLLVDEVLARNDWIDPDRLFLTGGSHGGFLVNWITTRTDRFRAAVTQRSVSNWISEAGTQQYPPRRMREEFGGTIWENFDLYWDRSPLAHADRVTTPTLVLHSDGDRITPLGQGEEWFYALKALGVPTRMVVFQGEGHALSRTGTPVNLVERLRRILGWFEEWDETPAPVGRDSPAENRPAAR
jgi:dipeptidyl aminopeptidase/acylaminoacyl peptidase